MDIWVISSSDGSHAGGFVAGVRLGTVLEIGVGPAGAVNADVPSGGDVGTAVGLRHDGDDGDAGGGADGLGTELGEERVAVGLGDGGDHLDELRGAGEAVLAAGGGLEGVEVDGLAAAGALGHGGDDLRDGADAGLLLGEARRYRHPTPAGRRLLPELRRSHGRRQRRTEGGELGRTARGGEGFRERS